MADADLKFTSVLEQEYETYKKLQAKLWQRFQGGFVLIKGDELQGIYPNQAMAMAKGYEKFGAGAFLVKEIFAPVWNLSFISDGVLFSDNICFLRC